MTTPHQTSHCEACGAPLPAKGSACLYCGRVFKKEEFRPQNFDQEMVEIIQPAPAETWEPTPGPQIPLRRPTVLKPVFWISFALVAAALLCACLAMGLLALMRTN